MTELANPIHLSRSQLYRKLKSMTGLPPNELIRDYNITVNIAFLRPGHIITIETSILSSTNISVIKKVRDTSTNEKYNY